MPLCEIMGLDCQLRTLRGTLSAQEAKQVEVEERLEASRERLEKADDPEENQEIFQEIAGLEVTRDGFIANIDALRQQ